MVLRHIYTCFLSVRNILWSHDHWLYRYIDGFSKISMHFDRLWDSLYIWNMFSLKIVF